MIQLFSTIPTIILSGNTSNAKTTTINMFLKKVLNTKFDFYTDSKKNTTKVITIFHFDLEINKIVVFDQSDKLIHEKSFLFDNGFEELVKYYNLATINGKLTSGRCHIYIKSNNKFCYNLIDTIGISLEHSEADHLDQLSKLKKYYINNIVLHMARSPSADTNIKCKNSNNFVLISHGDMIDYEKDPSLGTLYDEFKTLIEQNKIFIFSNVEKSKILDTKKNQYTMFGYNNIDKMFEIIFSNFKITIRQSDIRKINSNIQFDIKNLSSVSEIVKYTHTFNNKELYDSAIQSVNSLTTDNISNNLNLTSYDDVIVDIINYKKLLLSVNDIGLKRAGLLIKSKIIDNQQIPHSLKNLLLNLCNDSILNKTLLKDDFNQMIISNVKNYINGKLNKLIDEIKQKYNEIANNHITNAYMANITDISNSDVHTLNMSNTNKKRKYSH